MTTQLIATRQHHFRLGDDEQAIALARTADGHVLYTADGPSAIALERDAQGRCWLHIDGQRHAVFIATRGDEVFVHLDGEAHALRYQHPLQRFATSGAGSAEDSVRAPMPGSLVSLPVAAGDAVQRGQVLLVMESMKMETTITAPRDGVVQAVHYAVGQSFDRDALLLELESNA